MKTLNWFACIIFGMIAVLALIVSIFSKRYDLLAIAFACGCVSVIAYIDIKDPLL